MQTAKKITNFVINKVTTKAIFNKMKEQGLSSDWATFTVTAFSGYTNNPFWCYLMYGNVYVPATSYLYLSKWVKSRWIRLELF